MRVGPRCIDNLTAVVRTLAILIVLVIGGALLWRPADAWWLLDTGNLALLKGDRTGAALRFERGLELEPGWHALEEDDGRALLETDPLRALKRFRAADCGAPCLAEAGDAEIRLGRAHDAVDDYLAAHAVQRLGAAVDGLARHGRYDDAIALERALIVRLGSGMLAEADVASAYAQIGRLDQQAAGSGGQAAARYRSDAIRSFARASQLAPFNEGYLLSLGFSEAAWGDRRAARAAFERVLDLHPHQADAERGLSQMSGAPPGAR